MDQERSITIVYQCGNDVGRETLKGLKTGYYFDRENGIVKIFADAATVIVPLENYLCIISSG